LERYKCHTCKLILAEDELIDQKCPDCGDGINLLQKMCELDHCHCSHDIVESVAFCPKCGESICPKCGTHDVVGISRVTGYLQELRGFNEGKRQEVKDRQRYDI